MAVSSIAVSSTKMPKWHNFSEGLSLVLMLFTVYSNYISWLLICASWSEPLLSEYSSTTPCRFAQTIILTSCLFDTHYENLPIQIFWKINHRKIENFQTKNSNIFHISAQNIDCGYSLEPPSRGGSNEYPQFMFWAEIRKNNVYPFKPQFYYIKVGFKGVKII